MDRKISLFQQKLRKTDPRSGNFICGKGVRDTILENSSAKDYSKQVATSKTQELLTDKEMQILDKGAIKIVEHQYPD